MSRRAVLPLLCAVLGVVLVAPPAAGQEDPPTTLRIALNGYENNLTPFTATFGAAPNTHDLLMLVYDSLFWSQVSSDPEPWLAERAEPNADSTQWTVTLREGVTWHDGRPFTSEDVRFSFEYYDQQRAASGRYAHHVFDVPPLVGATVLDARTVRLEYGQPAPAFKTLPGADLPILPKHIWEGITDPRTAAQALPVGTGPYRLVQIVPDQLYRFEANEAYFKGRPTVDVLEMPIVRDPAAAFAALQTGEVAHVTRNVPPELFDQFSAEPGMRILEGTKFESNQLYFNALKPPLDDARLRHAMSLTIDSQAIVDTILLGHGRPGLPTFLHPQTAWALEGATVEHDPAAAQALLDGAGYVRGPDGIRVAPNGAPLQFSVLVNSFEPQDIRAAQLIGQQLEPLGVRLKAEALDPATLRASRAAPPGAVPGYDAYISVIESHAHVDPDALYYFFHSPGPKGFGASVTGWTNSAFDVLAEQATTAGAEERTRLLGEAQGMLAAENPLMVLWYRDGEYAYRPADYDGWLSDPGHGIFTKRSFLPEYVEAARAERGGAAPAAAAAGGAGSGATTWLVVAAAVVLVGGGALLVVRRRRAADTGDDE
ncbi:ABC transporter substrate-binding protein [Pseudonocardia kunmingensis]|uniref:Peptide/nickel transport system substrate-binding protein n=1 Tax=Pseudonocardia kunmingensis TaxID=630975 RepID=A0A543DP77_9PSEU|nr:ABC transporter substrate-binding protein [Pseudonocardia kunmingensis]TQM11119.1 peptide/nickel transport system substrate-binding protein [Pseudonocardia kunmingensis]